MKTILLVAKNMVGQVDEFRLYEYERQYSIGGEADIALHDLEMDNERKGRMYPIAGSITFISNSWYFRASKGHRRGRKSVKLNGKPINSSHAEIMLKHGYIISFGENDEITVVVSEGFQEETLKTAIPELTGLFDEIKMEFEVISSKLREFLGLDNRANTGVIMRELEGKGLFNASYEYNLARGLRNIIAHPSTDVQSIRREYIYEAMRALESIKKIL